MIVLGIHCGHNSSAALLVKGEIVGAAQEERFSKRKNQVAFPARAIGSLIDAHLGGEAKRIDRVAFATQEVDPIGLAVSRYSDFSVADHVKEMHAYWWPVFYAGQPNDGRYWIEMFARGERLNADHNVDVERLMRLPLPAATRLLSDVERPALMRSLFGFTGSHEVVEHHTCHAYYAFYGSALSRDRWDDVLVLTANSWGDGQNWTAFSVAPNGHLAKIAGGDDHGVARIYRFVTLILGMKPNEHEYKVMGLASYSRSQAEVAAAERVFYQALDFENGGFIRRAALKDSYFDLRNRLEGHRFDNIAAALQNWATAVTIAWARHWLAATGKRILCFSGGLSMNIKLNGELAKLEAVHDLKVPASGGDETLAIGACFASAASCGVSVVPMAHVYLGAPADGDSDWRTGVEQAGARCEEFSVRQRVTLGSIAKLLAANQIVARCVGPMEFGARALGNRSILANPADRGNLKRINEAIKNRDFWMPFTPSNSGGAC